MWRKWVLVVDDDVNVRSLFTGALEQQGYATVTCSDVYEALDLVRAVVPHLIILDLHMERGSGGLFLDYLRGAEYPILRQIPVLIVSGYLGQECVDGEGLNIVGLIEKPASLDALIQKVRQVIGEPVTMREGLRSGSTRLPGRAQMDKRVPRMQVTVGPTGDRSGVRHFHYCDGCDRQWAHDGVTCGDPWAWRCQKCSPRKTRESPR